MPDPNQPPPPTIPGYAVLNMADLDRMASAAANNAVRQLSDRAVTKEEAETIAEKGAEQAIDRLLERVFDVPTGDGQAKALIELRKDFTAIRASREMREAMIKHGFLAVTGLLITAFGTAIWYAIKGVGVK